MWTADTDAYSYANGAGTGTLPASGSGANGTQITLGSGAGLSDTGYTFAGWNDGSGTTYGAGTPYTLSSDGAPIVFTAVWTADTDAYSYANGAGTGTLPASGSGAN